MNIKTKIIKKMLSENLTKESDYRIKVDKTYYNKKRNMMCDCYLSFFMGVYSFQITGVFSSKIKTIPIYKDNIDYFLNKFNVIDGLLLTSTKDEIYKMDFGFGLKTKPKSDVYYDNDGNAYRLFFQFIGKANSQLRIYLGKNYFQIDFDEFYQTLISFKNILEKLENESYKDSTIRIVGLYDNKEKKEKIYSFDEGEIIEKPTTNKTNSNKANKANEKVNIECEGKGCSFTIKSKNISDYSKKQFGKALCMNCQKKAKEYYSKQSCSYEDCDEKLHFSVAKYSLKRFGKFLCKKHQK